MNCYFCQQELSPSDSLMKCRKHEDCLVAHYPTSNKIFIMQFNSRIYCLVNLTNNTCSYHFFKDETLLINNFDQPVSLDEIQSHIHRLNKLKAFL